MKRRKRFAIVIGVAAVGAMALGAQTAAAATYNTKLTITQDQGPLIHGHVVSGDRKKCEVGRWVTLFKQRPGADRKLGADRSAGPRERQLAALGERGDWSVGVPQAKAGWHVYATVSPKVGDGFVCNGDRSPTYTVK
jgi:hypothetical protein